MYIISRIWLYNSVIVLLVVIQWIWEDEVFCGSELPPELPLY